MKKLIILAFAITVQASADAQSVSDVSQYTVGVPQVLSITTTPGNAVFTHSLSEGQLLSGKTLETVIWTVKSNGNWKASSMWAITGLASHVANNGLLNASVNSFRNALKCSSDNGATWFSLQPSNVYFVDPIPGYGLQGPTPAAGHNVTVLAKLEALNYNVVPGTYVATAIVTVTAL